MFVCQSYTNVYLKATVTDNAEYDYNPKLYFSIGVCNTAISESQTACARSKNIVNVHNLCIYMKYCTNTARTFATVSLIPLRSSSAELTAFPWAFCALSTPHCYSTNRPYIILKFNNFPWRALGVKCKVIDSV